MREDNEKLQTESNAAFGFAAILLNLLIFLALYGSLWMVQSILSQSNLFGAFLRDYAMYQ